MMRGMALGFLLLQGCATAGDAAPVKPAGAQPEDAPEVPSAPPIVDAPFTPGTPKTSPPACTNLQCARPKCADGKETTLKGRVLAPSGTLPLYNVIVYVPNGELKPIGRGVT